MCVRVCMAVAAGMVWVRVRGCLICMFALTAAVTSCVLCVCMLSRHACCHVMCVVTSCVLSCRVCCHIMCVVTSCVLSRHACCHVMCVVTSCVLSHHACCHVMRVVCVIVQIPPPLGVKGQPHMLKKAQRLVLSTDIPLRYAPIVRLHNLLFRTRRCKHSCRECPAPRAIHRHSMQIRYSHLKCAGTSH